MGNDIFRLNFLTEPEKLDILVIGDDGPRAAHDRSDWRDGLFSGYFFMNKVVFLRWTGWKFYRKIILSGIWRQLGNGGGIQSLSIFGGVIDAVEF